MTEVPFSRERIAHLINVFCGASCNRTDATRSPLVLRRLTRRQSLQTSHLQRSREERAREIVRLVDYVRQNYLKQDCSDRLDQLRHLLQRSGVSIDAFQINPEELQTMESETKLCESKRLVAKIKKAIEDSDWLYISLALPRLMLLFIDLDVTPETSGFSADEIQLMNLNLNPVVPVGTLFE